MATADDITVLNTLIATTLDSVKGYDEASEDSDGSHAELFRAMAGDRRQVVSALQAQVRALGGNPEDEGSAMGAVHRGFMRLKELVVARDEEAVVDEVERGEDYLKAKFKTALESDALDPATRGVIESAYASVRAGHDRVSAIKHALN